MSVIGGEGRGFEAEVRIVAEAVWGLPPGTCQPAHFENDPVIRELDGIARTRDATHLIMMTTSRKLDKLRDDVKKLNAAEHIERKNALAVVKWFISRDQLDAQHIDFARKNNVTALTLDQFKRRFFDFERYIALRNVCAFGSARNPADNSVTLADDAYVSLPISVEDHRGEAGSRTRHVAPEEAIQHVAELLIAGNIVVLMAPFGSGKSLSTREIFREIWSRYRNGTAVRIPIAINLREHWGQPYADEILERHARVIGFPRREDLVVAWRAGLADLLLDGFDEVASQTIVRLEDRNFMRDARRQALTGVRDFLSKVPAGVGVFICGRDHYFDSDLEMAHALALSVRRYIIVRLGEFTEERAESFLRRYGWNQRLPDWLPRKPLILSYLVHHGLVESVLGIDGSKGFGHAWDEFLQRICEREARLERAVMDPDTVRGVLERLAHHVRALPSGTGPITGLDLAEAYRTATGQIAGEGVLAQLQRLPGLTQRDQEVGARSFVDADMLAALQGSATAKLILGQLEDQTSDSIGALCDNALGMSAYVLRNSGASSSVAIAVAERLFKQSRGRDANSQFIADCVSIAIELAVENSDSVIDFRNLVVEGGMFGTLNFEDLIVTGLELRDSIIEEIVLGPSSGASRVRLSACSIGRVSGVASAEGLPSNIFGDGCKVDHYDDVATTNAVLQSHLDPGIKALLTILRKLYKQKGAGRKLGAFSRGITQADVLSKINNALNLLEKNGFLSIFNQVVHPVRKQQARVEAILRAPAISTDDIVQKARSL